MCKIGANFVISFRSFLQYLSLSNFVTHFAKLVDKFEIFIKIDILINIFLIWKFRTFFFLFSGSFKNFKTSKANEHLHLVSFE